MPLTIDTTQAVNEHMATTHSRFLVRGTLFLQEEVMIGGGGEESFEALLEKVTTSYFFAP